MSQIEKKYYHVDSIEMVNLLIDHINQSTVIAYDTETTGLNVRKDQVVGWSASGEEGVGFYLPTQQWNKETEQLEECLIGGKSAHDITKKILPMLLEKQLVMHNASFDCRITKNYYGIDLLPSLWVDTALLVHTVQEEGAGMGVFGLKPLAISIQQHIGLDVQEAANKEQVELKESIKANGGSITKESYEIFKADMEILSKYAAADTDLTLRVCNYFLQKLKEEQLENFFFVDEVMPLYKEVTVPMEEFGVALDIPLLEKTREDIINDLQANKKFVIDSILSIPEAKEWVVDTALVNYPPSNRGNWAQNLVMMHSLPLERSEKTGKYSLTKKSIDQLEESNVKQFLLTNDLTLLDEMEVVRISMSMWKDENEGDYLNIQSKKHLGEIAFKYMGIKPLTQTKRGQDQFDMDMLEELAKTHDWANNLRIYNKLLKIKSTYIDRFLDGQEDGRYYFYYKQNGTVSGRYGSDAQQLPKPKEEGEDAPIIVHYTNVVREFLIAGEGRKLIDNDYTSLEPHCFASVSGDKGLQDIFNNGWDFYSTIAIKTEKLDQDTLKYPNGVSPDTKSPIFLKKLDPVKRQQAKSYSLGVAYGMSGYALAMTLGITAKEGDKLVEGYLSGFPQLREWMVASRNQAKTQGFVTNKVGRIRHLPQVKRIFEKFGDQVLDWRFRKELETRYGKDPVNKMYMDYRNGINNCLNFQLQSLAAAVVNRAAIQINRKAKELGVDGRVQAQIHDQLIINVREDQAEMFMPYVQQLMELTTQLPGVTLKAPPQIANNFAEGH